MLPHESVLSDVHLRHQSADEPTAFSWTWPAEDFASHPLEADEDGDLPVKRRRRGGSLRLRHAHDGTSLADVGLQVWRGALVLADLLVAQPKLVEGAVVLEMGAGCGLCGLLAARLGARMTYVTDIGDGVLRNAATNARDNGCDPASVRIRHLDWQEPWVPVDWPRLETDEFAWREQDREALLEGADRALILAADCVYDDRATDAFVNRLAELLRWLPEASALVALERRINFCLDSLSVRAPAAEHFRRRLDEVVARTHGVGALEYQRLRVDTIPQRFDSYERCGELELYRVGTRVLRTVSRVDDLVRGGQYY